MSWQHRKVLLQVASSGGSDRGCFPATSPQWSNPAEWSHDPSSYCLGSPASCRFRAAAPAPSEPAAENSSAKAEVLGRVARAPTQPAAAAPRALGPWTRQGQRLTVGKDRGTDSFCPKEGQRGRMTGKG